MEKRKEAEQAEKERKGEEVNIAIDFDGTISRDDQYFATVIHHGIRYDHRFYIVTARPKGSSKDIEKFLDEYADWHGRGWAGARPKIIETGELSKKDCMDELGIRIDIWIDDCPEDIITDYKK